jgi:hypothetical protein
MVCKVVLQLRLEKALEEQSKKALEELLVEVCKVVSLKVKAPSCWCESKFLAVLQLRLEKVLEEQCKMVLVEVCKVVLQLRLEKVSEEQCKKVMEEQLVEVCMVV